MQERFARKNEAADLRRAFVTLDTKKDEQIDAEELAQFFAKLQHKVKKVLLLGLLSFSYMSQWLFMMSSLDLTGPCGSSQILKI